MKTDTELREMDAWIAVNLFGGVRHQDEPCREGVDIYPFAMWQGGELDCLVSEFRPTTDPTAAMQVLEKCVGETSVTIRKQSNGRFCIWWTESENMVEQHLFGSTLPMAICQLARELFKEDAR